MNPKITIESGDIKIVCQNNLYNDFFKTIESFPNLKISSDYHLLKEFMDAFREGKSPSDPKRTEKIIEMHNKFVKPSDIFLLEGDLSESEYCADSRFTEKLVEVCQKLNGKKKILIRGNNDTMPNDFYKRCGFDEVYEEGYLESPNYTFSHYPVKVIPGKLNVHGHIHATCKYWGVLPENHFDVYWEEWKKPLTLKEIKELYPKYIEKCNFVGSQGDMY